MGYALRTTDAGGKIIECEPAVEAKDYVYVTTDGKVGRAQSDSLLTMPAVGYVKKRLGNNKALVVQFDVEDGLSGLTPKQRFFISPDNPGKVTNIAPVATEHILQCVAEAKSTTMRMVHVDPTNYVIRQ